MPPKIFFIFLLIGTFFMIPKSTFGQKTFIITGTVLEKSSQKPIEGAGISTKVKLLTVSDHEGNFEIELLNDTVTLYCNLIGYKQASIKLVEAKNNNLRFLLESTDIQTSEVVIESKSDTSLVEQDNLLLLTTKEARLLPSLTGESDLLRLAQLKPGVQSAFEGSAGIYVRGGGPDQSLYLLDGAPLYNPNHLFGFVSIFNGDAVKEMQLYKSNFPAKFGGRLSLVLDAKTKAPNLQKASVFGGIGLMITRLGTEIPIIKNKLAVRLSLRRSYYDVFTRKINKDNKDVKDYEPIPSHYFYDGNICITYLPTKKDKITISGYLGNDVFEWKEKQFDFGLKWGNTTASTSWEHYYNSDLTQKVNIFYGAYKYLANNQVDVYKQSLETGIQNTGIQTEWEYKKEAIWQLNTGFYGSYYRFNLGHIKIEKDQALLEEKTNNKLALDGGAFIWLERKLTTTTAIKIGSRLSSFFSDSKKPYFGIEPRTSFQYKPDKRSTISISYVVMYQYLHMLSNSGASLPTDIWYPSSSSIKPQVAQQIALSMNRTFLNGKIKIHNESYYKLGINQIDLKDGSSIYSANNIEAQIITGKGWNYGNEFLIEKIKGNTTGWVGYTLAWSQRQFDQINRGERYFSRYDRRHDISVVVIQKISKRFSASVSWIYNSGNAITLPVARYFIQDVPGTPYNLTIPVYLDRNTFRMPPSHRMDMGITYRFAPKRGEADLTFSIYNLYNRQNPYFIYYDTIRNDGDEIIKFKAMQVSLLPMIPSLTFNFNY